MLLKNASIRNSSHVLVGKNDRILQNTIKLGALPHSICTLDQNMHGLRRALPLGASKS